jgi:hypothetical protein
MTELNSIARIDSFGVLIMEARLTQNEQDDLELDEIDIQEIATDTFKITIRATNNAGQPVERELIIDRSQAEALCASEPPDSELHKKTKLALSGKGTAN